MINIILNLLFQYDKLGDKLGFSKDEIDKLIKEHVLDDNGTTSCNAFGSMLLEKHGYVTKKDVSDKFNLQYEKENENSDKMSLYWYFNSFDEILKEDNYKTEIIYLDSLAWEQFDYYSSGSWAELNDFYDDINEENLKDILKYLIKNKCDIFVDDSVDEYILVEKTNSKVEDGKIYLKDSKNIWFKISESELENSDDCEELVSRLNSTYEACKSDADIIEAEKQVIDSFESEIGHYERKYDEKTKKEYIRLRCDFINWDQLWEFYIDESKHEYGSGLYEFDDESTYTGDDLESIGHELDWFEFRTPDYNYIYGDIKNTDLNSRISEDIYDL